MNSSRKEMHKQLVILDANLETQHAIHISINVANSSFRSSCHKSEMIPTAVREAILNCFVGKTNVHQRLPHVARVSADDGQQDDETRFS